MRNARKPFEEKEEYIEPFENLLAKFGTIEKGTLVTYHEITAVTKYNRFTTEGDYLIEKFKKHLRKRGVVRCVDNIGIQLLTDEDAARRSPDERLGRAIRQGSKMLRETDTIDGSKIGDHDRRKLHLVRETTRFNRRLMKRARKEFNSEARASETIPRRKKGK